MLKLCTECGRRFVPGNPQRLMCSLACRLERNCESHRRYYLVNRARLREQNRESEYRYKQKREIAYALLKQRGMALDHLPTREGRLSFSYQLLQEHLPGVLPPNRKD